MRNKKNIAFLLLSLMVVISMVIGISFAYFSVNKQIDNSLPVSVTIANGISANFTVTGNSNVTVTVTGDKMLTDKKGTLAGSNNTSISVNLTSISNVTCTYDLVWRWNTGNNAYYKTSGATNEFTISGTTGTLSFLETQLNNYSSATTLGTYTITTDNSTTIQNWNITSRFYNLNLVQDSHAGKTYSGKIGVANALCLRTGAYYTYWVSNSTYNQNSVPANSYSGGSKINVLFTEANKSTLIADYPLYVKTLVDGSSKTHEICEEGMGCFSTPSSHRTYGTYYDYGDDEIVEGYYYNADVNAECIMMSSTETVCGDIPNYCYINSTNSYCDLYYEEECPGCGYINGYTCYVNDNGSAHCAGVS